MTKGLRAMISDAEGYLEEACDISDVICMLCPNHQWAISVLLAAYKEAIVKQENQWRMIEAREDYSYSDRDFARADFLKAEGFI